MSNNNNNTSSRERAVLAILLPDVRLQQGCLETQATKTNNGLHTDEDKKESPDLKSSSQNIKSCLVDKEQESFEQNVLTPDNSCSSSTVHATATCGSVAGSLSVGGVSSGRGCKGTDDTAQHVQGEPLSLLLNEPATVHDEAVTVVRQKQAANIVCKPVYVKRVYSSAASDVAGVFNVEQPNCIDHSAFTPIRSHLSKSLSSLSVGRTSDDGQKQISRPSYPKYHSPFPQRSSRYCPRTSYTSTFSNHNDGRKNGHFTASLSQLWDKTANLGKMTVPSGSENSVSFTHNTAKSINSSSSVTTDTVPQSVANLCHADVENSSDENTDDDVDDDVDAVDDDDSLPPLRMESHPLLSNNKAPDIFTKINADTVDQSKDPIVKTRTYSLGAKLTHPQETNLEAKLSDHSSRIEPRAINEVTEQVSRSETSQQAMSSHQRGVRNTPPTNDTEKENKKINRRTSTLYAMFNTKSNLVTPGATKSLYERSTVGGFFLDPTVRNRAVRAFESTLCNVPSTSVPDLVVKSNDVTEVTQVSPDEPSGVNIRKLIRQFNSCVDHIKPMPCERTFNAKKNVVNQGKGSHAVRHQGSFESDCVMTSSKDATITKLQKDTLLEQNNTSKNKEQVTIKEMIEEELRIQKYKEQELKQERQRMLQEFIVRKQTHISQPNNARDEGKCAPHKYLACAHTADTFKTKPRHVEMKKVYKDTLLTSVVATNKPGDKNSAETDIRRELPLPQNAIINPGSHLNHVSNQMTDEIYQIRRELIEQERHFKLEQQKQLRMLEEHKQKLLEEEKKLVARELAVQKLEQEQRQCSSNENQMQINGRFINRTASADSLKSPSIEGTLSNISSEIEQKSYECNSETHMKHEEEDLAISSKDDMYREDTSTNHLNYKLEEKLYLKGHMVVNEGRVVQENSMSKNDMPVQSSERIKKKSNKSDAVENTGIINLSQEAFQNNCDNVIEARENVSKSSSFSDGISVKENKKFDSISTGDEELDVDLKLRNLSLTSDSKETNQRISLDQAIIWQETLDTNGSDVKQTFVQPENVKNINGELRKENGLQNNAVNNYSYVVKSGEVEHTNTELSLYATTSLASSQSCPVKIPWRLQQQLAPPSKRVQAQYLKFSELNPIESKLHQPHIYKFTQAELHQMTHQQFLKHKICSELKISVKTRNELRKHGKLRSELEVLCEMEQLENAHLLKIQEFVREQKMNHNKTEFETEAEDRNNCLDGEGIKNQLDCADTKSCEHKLKEDSNCITGNTIGAENLIQTAPGDYTEASHDKVAVELEVSVGQETVAYNDNVQNENVKFENRKCENAETNEENPKSTGTAILEKESLNTTISANESNQLISIDEAILSEVEPDQKSCEITPKINELMHETTTTANDVIADASSARLSEENNNKVVVIKPVELHSLNSNEEYDPRVKDDHVELEEYIDKFTNENSDRSTLQCNNNVKTSLPCELASFSDVPDLLNIKERTARENRISQVEGSDIDFQDDTENRSVSQPDVIGQPFRRLSCKECEETDCIVGNICNESSVNKSAMNVEDSVFDCQNKSEQVSTTVNGTECENCILEPITNKNAESCSELVSTHMIALVPQEYGDVSEQNVSGNDGDDPATTTHTIITSPQCSISLTQKQTVEVCVTPPEDGENKVFNNVIQDEELFKDKPELSLPNIAIAERSVKLDSSADEKSGAELLLSHDEAVSRPPPPKSPITVEEWVASLPVLANQGIGWEAHYHSAVEEGENEESGNETQHDDLKLGAEAHQLYGSGGQHIPSSNLQPFLLSRNRERVCKEQTLTSKPKHDIQLQHSQYSSITLTTLPDDQQALEQQDKKVDIITVEANSQSSATLEEPNSTVTAETMRSKWCRCLATPVDSQQKEHLNVPPEYESAEPVSAISAEKRQLLSGLRGKQNSFNSEASGASAISGLSRSSLESLLDARQNDAVEILLNLGFGGHDDNDDLLSRVPIRFLEKPSQVKGNDLRTFLEHEYQYERMMDTNDWVPGLSYQGIRKASMTTSPLLAKLVKARREQQRREEEFDELLELPPNATKFANLVNQITHKNRLNKRSQSDANIGPKLMLASKRITDPMRSGRVSVAGTEGWRISDSSGSRVYDVVKENDDKSKSNKWRSILSPENRRLLNKCNRESPERLPSRFLLRGADSQYNDGTTDALKQNRKPCIMPSGIGLRNVGEEHSENSKNSTGNIQRLISRESNSDNSTTSAVHRVVGRNVSVWSMASSLTSVDSQEEDVTEQRRLLALQLNTNRLKSVTTNSPEVETFIDVPQAPKSKNTHCFMAIPRLRRPRRTSTPKRLRTFSLSTSSGTQEIDDTIQEEAFFSDGDVKDNRKKTAGNSCVENHETNADATVSNISVACKNKQDSLQTQSEHRISLTGISEGESFDSCYTPSDQVKAIDFQDNVNEGHDGHDNVRQTPTVRQNGKNITQGQSCKESASTLLSKSVDGLVPFQNKETVLSTFKCQRNTCLKCGMLMACPKCNLGVSKNDFSNIPEMSWRRQKVSDSPDAAVRESESSTAAIYISAVATLGASAHSSSDVAVRTSADSGKGSMSDCVADDIMLPGADMNLEFVTTLTKFLEIHSRKLSSFKNSVFLDSGHSDRNPNVGVSVGNKDTIDVNTNDSFQIAVHQCKRKRRTRNWYNAKSLHELSSSNEESEPFIQELVSAGLKRDNEMPFPSTSSKRKMPIKFASQSRSFSGVVSDESVTHAEVDRPTAASFSSPTDVFDMEDVDKMLNLIKQQLLICRKWEQCFNSSFTPKTLVLNQK